ncbi:POTRA domain-containing protein, partial [Pseudoalteromonas sp. GW168-MNA-CIBAN-0100]
PHAQNDCASEQPTPSSSNNLRRQLDQPTPLLKQSSNAKIANITLQQLNVFNTELEAENNALFRFANRAHIQTEPEVIKSILLFESGDNFDPKKLAESERLLRKQNYLYDAQVIATENCEGNVNVTVVTRDLW